MRSAPLVAAALLAAATAACGGDRFDPSAGDCLRIGDADPTGPLTELTLVSCDEPHELEVYATVELGPDELSGDARRDAVAEGCLGDAFADYVGVPQDESPLQVLPLPPTPEQVEAGDRTVRCTVRQPDGGPTTGSVRGSRPA